MFKQFNLAQCVFADPIILSDALGNPILTAPPQQPVGKLQYTTNGEGWYAVYSQAEVDGISASITGDGAIWEENGQIRYSGRKPSPNHKWDDKKKSWVNLTKTEQKAQKAEQLDQAKAAKLNEINQQAQAFVSAVAKLDETPEFERSTWQEQANEARAWFENRATPTPKLDLLAQQRGVPAEVLRQKCYEKATSFYQLSFMVAGQRQGLEDRLKQATTLEEIEAIEIAYQLPQGGL